VDQRKFGGTVTQIHYDTIKIVYKVIIDEEKKYFCYLYTELYFDSNMFKTYSTIYKCPFLK